MGQRLTYWLFLGAIGYTAFFVLRPVIDFNAKAPIQENRGAVEQKAENLISDLGFSADTLNLLTLRRQHLNYYEILQDSLDENLPSISELHKQDLFLSSWFITVGGRIEQNRDFYLEYDELFNLTGLISFRFEDQGKLRRLITNPRLKNPTFVPGDSLPSIARRIAGEIFGYELNRYSLQEVSVGDSLSVLLENNNQAKSLQFADNRVGNNTIFKWKKSDIDYRGPHLLELEISPMIREVSTTYSSRVQFGASVVSFRALEKHEPIVLDDGDSNDLNNAGFIIFFISIGFLVGLVIFKGIQYINRGHVDWKRAFIVMITVGLAVFSWRLIYLLNTYDPFISTGSFLVLSINFLLFGVVAGLYGALAYIAWEAMARSEEQHQLRLVDAYWQAKFFFRETGDGLLRGYAFGGVLLGVFTLFLVLFNTFFYQFDSQFGFMEASIRPRLLTINISAWSAAWLVSLGHVGVTACFLKDKMLSDKLFYPVASIVLGLLFAGSASLFGIEGPAWYDILFFTGAAPVILFVFRQAGLMTFSVGWWLFISIILISPYLGSSSLSVAYVGWVQVLILILPLVYGFISYRYGNSISDFGSYVPEYQEKMSHHLRMEKEIEIARESQFKLMPLKPPSVPDIDVYGFFMPSFEVGGDYFDYVVSNNGQNEPHALVMTVADVSGKAMKAAMHAVFTSGLLLSRLHKDQPASILKEITPTIYHRTDPKTFITCLISQYRFSDRTLNIANAGHCLPVIKRDGKADFIRTPDPRYPLGLKVHVDYGSLDIILSKGDFILFYSDGLPEAVNPEGQRFGFDSMLELVESLDTEHHNCNEIAMEIKRRIQKFSDYQLADDTTIICLKV